LFKVVFFPLDTTSLAEPMDQTVIQSFKKAELLQRIVLSEADADDLVSQLKNINLKNYILAILLLLLYKCTSVEFDFRIYFARIMKSNSWLQ
ncbi:hypothetical protein T11_12560, partial [Trichinella zimbabwensis]